MAERQTEQAHAKINPFLRVLGGRDDGYHDIETLVLPLTLHDTLTVEALDPGELAWVLDVVEAEGPDVPAGDQNLAWIAAEALRSAAGRSDRARIEIHKRIPVAAGLGGGSADAAATLRALDRLWGLELGADRLAELAVEIGSDVPALLHRGAVVARGRGNRIDPLDLPPTSWVLLTQPFGVSAGDAYRWWDEAGGEMGPDPWWLLQTLVSGDVVRAGGLLVNDLETVVVSRHPEVAEARKRLLDAGALGAVMSGSGPTVAGLARNSLHAEEIAAAVEGIVVGSLS